MIRHQPRISLPAIGGLLLAVGLALGGARVSSAAGGTVRGRVEGDAGYLGGTIVYLVGDGGGAPPTAPVLIDQKAMQFAPRVAPVVQGTTVRFRNSDPTDHRVFSPDGEGFDLGVWGQGVAKDHRFDEEGVFTILCRIHPRRAGDVPVFANPWFTIADSAGRFEISEVPAGDYEVAVWKERRRAEPVAVTAGEGTAMVVEMTLGR